MHDARPGQYWHGPGFFTVQHRLARHALRDAAHALDAAKSIEAGLAAMPAEDRESEWAATFGLRLATAHADAGDAERAVMTARAVVDTADALGFTALHDALRRFCVNFAEQGLGAAALKGLTERPFH